MKLTPQMKRALEALGECRSLKNSLAYPASTLNALVRHGLAVNLHPGRAKGQYAITPAGRRALAQISGAEG